MNMTAIADFYFKVYLNYFEAIFIVEFRIQTCRSFYNLFDIDETFSWV
jgi:hypothetical protein